MRERGSLIRSLTSVLFVSPAVGKQKKTWTYTLYFSSPRAEYFRNNANFNAGEQNLCSKTDMKNTLTYDRKQEVSQVKARCDVAWVAFLLSLYINIPWLSFCPCYNSYGTTRRLCHLKVNMHRSNNRCCCSFSEGQSFNHEIPVHHALPNTVTEVAHQTAISIK